MAAALDLPPLMTEEQLEALFSHIADYQLAHGSVLKSPRLQMQLDSAVPIAHPIGISAFPSPFPRKLFHQALELQSLFNEVYARISEDHDWLGHVLGELIERDELARKLWAIWEQVSDEGEAQPLRCGIWRSDYMLHSPRVESLPPPPAEVDLDIQCLLSEFNTYSCAGGCHAARVADMHRYLASRGYHMDPSTRSQRLPANGTVKAIVQALDTAHRAYGCSAAAKQTAVLMTVQPYNVNTADERPIEYGLWEECDPPIPLYRVEFPHEVLERCSLGPNRELLLLPPPLSLGAHANAVEISVVYHRAGYAAHEYSDAGIAARLTLERSRAVKCPTVLSQLAGFKKVQQQLTVEGELERFVRDRRDAKMLRAVFGQLYSMEDESRGREVALQESEDVLEDYVLKLSSADGGGNNVYGRHIRRYLEDSAPDSWENYVLMARIIPPPVSNVLISHRGVHQGPIISELGVYGACLWQRISDQGDCGSRSGQRTRIITNGQSGWSFKTKPAETDEMSVVKGSGCFDCPSLVDCADM